MVAHLVEHFFQQMKGWVLDSLLRQTQFVKTGNHISSAMFSIRDIKGPWKLPHHINKKYVPCIELGLLNKRVKV